jgi:iron complex transport system ATP-binding protein
MTVLSVRGLNLSLGGRPILRDLALQVAAGEFFVIIGPNGSGKTSLLRIVANLIRPDSGSVLLFGRPLKEYSRRQLSRRLALVPQQMPLDFPFRVQETVLMGRSPHLGLLGVEGPGDYAVARQAMQFTDVLHLADRRLDQLSGGERQRVIIARALCQEPEIILLDEPTASLDPAHQVQVMDLMERLRRERGITVLMVSHDLNLAAMYGDRLLLLEEGRAAASGIPAEVLSGPRLAASYGCVMQVDLNPCGNVPRVLPIPEKFRTLVGPEEQVVS